MTPANSAVMQLRELCAWYEWGSGPHYPVIAEALQDAADAVQAQAMSVEAANVLIRVWGHFVGREAAVDNPPPSCEQTDRVELLRCAVEDLTRMVEQAGPDKKRQLARLLREQLEVLEREERKLKWPTK